MSQSNLSYRIPKPVSGTLRLWGLTVRGWIFFGLGVVIAIFQLFFWLTHTSFKHISASADINHIMLHVALSVLIVGLPYLFFREERFIYLIYTTFYHYRNSRLLRWESDPDVLTKEIISGNDR